MLKQLLDRPGKAPGSAAARQVPSDRRGATLLVVAAAEMFAPGGPFHASVHPRRRRRRNPRAGNVPGHKCGFVHMCGHRHARRVGKLAGGRCIFLILLKRFAIDWFEIKTQTPKPKHRHIQKTTNLNTKQTKKPQQKKKDTHACSCGFAPGVGHAEPLEIADRALVATRAPAPFATRRRRRGPEC
jgi:hypothetical protein